jgi:hypothetical protein
MKEKKTVWKKEMVQVNLINIIKLKISTILGQLEISFNNL